MTNSIHDLLETQVMLLIGANTTEAHPVTGYRIKQAVKRGAKLIVADPRRIELVRYADLWLRHRPGTDIALLNGLAHVILQENLWDQAFVAERSEGFEEFRRKVEEYPLERVEKITGVPAEQIRAAARLYGQAERACIIYAMGITQHTSGTQNVLAVANLAILTGNVGRPGTGVYPLRGQNNVQGACDMGALPNYYPGYQLVEAEENRQKFETIWRTELPSTPGLTLTEMMNAAARGEIAAMYIMGENPMLADPDVNHVRKAMENLEFLLVQDIFLTETARLAHVVLPAVTFAEKEGTFTNTERRIQRVHQAINPPGEARPDWQIILELARRLGHDWHYPRGPEQIMEEIALVNPLYGGITYARLEEGGIQWPCPTPGHPGTPYLHAEKFARGKGRFHAVEHIPAAEEPDAEYPLLLNTGRNLYQFHTGSMTRRTRLDLIRPEELMQIHPQDADRFGIKDGDRVEVTSRRGRVETRVQVTDLVPPGMVFLTFHYQETPTNVLTNAAFDPVCKIPELKISAVKIRKL
ncbi:formate dehydrogenase [Carboxydocella sp. ULO1]|nr:formate dehydrogenase [Carboxydocella sp. ULO1]